MKGFRKTLVSLIAVGLVAVVGCARQEEPMAEEAAVVEEPAAEPIVAVASIQSRADVEVSGTVSFVQMGAGAPVAIAAHFEGVAEGMHGLHVHESGDCTAEDFTSAGGHFNPKGVPHAGPGDAERHAGDLGNIECNADGVCHLELESDELSVEAGPASVVGRAVILHEKMDDLMSQPTGAAGSRLACGVIELAG